MTSRVAIAGSTGSIGTQTLDVVRPRTSGRPGPTRSSGLSVGTSVDAVVAQARSGARRSSSVTDDRRARAVAARCRTPWSSPIGRLVDDADVVVNGVVGFAGLPVTIETLRAGKRLALANKESLIAAGPVVQPLRSTPGAELVPVDSEHCALHQCLRSSHDTDREVAGCC